MSEGNMQGANASISKEEPPSYSDVTPPHGEKQNGTSPAYPPQSQGAYPDPSSTYPPQAQHNAAYPPQSQGAGGYPPPTQGAWTQGGYPQQHQAQAQYSQPTNRVTVVTTQPAKLGGPLGHKPSNYLALSIFNLLCCCWVFGLIALVYSIQVDSAWNRGDTTTAYNNSVRAKRWNIAALVAGLISGVSAGIVVAVIQVQSAQTVTTISRFS